MTQHSPHSIRQTLLQRALASKNAPRLAVRPDFNERVFRAASMRESFRSRLSGRAAATIAVASLLTVSTAIAGVVTLMRQDRKPTQYACVECLEELRFMSPAFGDDVTREPAPRPSPRDSQEQAFREIAVIQDLRISGDNRPFFDARMSPRGAIAAREAQRTGVVRVYSPAGVEIAAVDPARTPGLGPQLTTLYWGWVGDSLWFFSNSRVHIVQLAATPNVVSSRLVPSETPGPPGTTPRARSPYPSIQAVYRNGDLLLNQIFPADEVRVALGRSAQDDVPGSFLVRTDADHKLVAFAASMPLGWRDGCVHRIPDPGIFGASHYSIPLCRVSGNRAISPDGRRIAYAMGDAPVTDPAVVRIAQIIFPGDTVYSREYRIPALRLTDAQRDSILAAAAERATRSPDPRLTAFTDSVLRAEMPTHRSPVDNMIVGNDGYVLLWLMRFSAAPKYLLIDPQGNAVGMFALPARVLIVEVSRDALLGIDLRDSPGNSPHGRVVRYRVPG